MSPPIDILMYHSIAPGSGPLAIAPDVFRMQMQTLADAGVRGISLGEWISSPERSGLNAGRAAVITFDDGYADFAEVAFPIIESFGWGCTVFIVPEWMGRTIGRHRHLSWHAARALAARGVEFGAHSVTHAALTALPEAEAVKEVIGSKVRIESELGCIVHSFAPPYGYSSPAVRRAIARHFRCSVGTRLAQATQESDRYDLPRIEMWYFREAARWRRHVEIGPTPYFRARQILRAIGQKVRPPTTYVR